MVGSRLALAGGLCLALGVAAPASAQVFDDLAPAAGLVGDASSVVKNAIGSGITWVDIDGDGTLELIHSPPLSPPVLIRQGPLGLVEDPGVIIPATPPAQCSGAAPIDMDGDGDLDLFLVRDGANVLLRNDLSSGGGFVDVSAESLPGRTRWSSAFAVGDVDGDGDDDIYVGNYTSAIAFPSQLCGGSALLINDGTGRFVDRADDWGVAGIGCTLSVALSDFDNDGDLDLLEANDFGNVLDANRLYRNDGPEGAGGWAFVEVSAETGFDQRLFGMGIGTTDVNDDGWLDYVVSSVGLMRALLGGPEGFTEATRALGLDVALDRDGAQVTWAPLFEDIDGDGWVDLVVVGGDLRTLPNDLLSAKHGSHLLFAGQADGTFDRWDSGWSVPEPGWNMGRSAALADFDDDGWVDMAVGHAQGLLSIYQQVGASGVPLRVTVRPTETGPSGAGTRLVASCGGWERHRELTGGGGFLGAGDGVIRVTFPAPCQAPGEPVTLTVRWPSGFEQVVATETGGVLELQEPDWLTATTAGVTVDLTDGSLVGPVAITAEGAQVEAATEASAGVWSASWTGAPSGTAAVVTVAVDGQKLAVHPTVTWPAAAPTVDVFSVPQDPVTSRPWSLFVTPRANDGTLAGSGATVTVAFDGGPPLATVDQGDGRYLWAGEAPAAGAVSVQVAVGGTPHGAPWVADVAPPVDPLRSVVRFEDTVQLAQPPYPPLKVIAVLVDRNGAPVAADPAAIVLKADGVELAPDSAVVSGAQALQFYSTEGLSDGDSLVLEVAGVPMPPRTLTRLAQASDVAGLVAEATSRATFDQMAIYGDGMDRGSGLIYLYDAAGDPLPDLGDAPVLTLTGVDLLPDTLVPLAGRWLYEFQASAAVVDAMVAVSWYGTPVLEGTVNLWAPAQLPPALDAVHSELTAEASDDSGGLDSFGVLFVPRMPDERLAGSGLAVSGTATSGQLSGFVYEGTGRYRATFVPTGPGMATVTVSVATPAFSMSVGIDVGGTTADEGPELTEPGPEPGPEQAPEAETMTGPDVADLAPDVDVVAPVEVDTSADAEPSPAPDPAEDVVATPDSAPSDATEADASAPEERPTAPADKGCQSGPRAPWPLAFVLLWLVGLRRRKTVASAR